MLDKTIDGIVNVNNIDVLNFSEYQNIMDDMQYIREYTGYKDHSRDLFENDYNNPEWGFRFSCGLAIQDTGRQHRQATLMEQDG